jgi:hypothetical protein
MNRGYIKLYRKSLNSRVFQSEGLFKVWIWCLLKASHEETWISVKTGRGITEVYLYPGQFIFGRKSAAKELKMSASTVWKRILKLKKMGNLNIESNTKYSLIIIVNWETYQGSLKKSNNQVTAKEHRKRLKGDTDRSGGKGASDVGFKQTQKVKGDTDEKSKISYGDTNKNTRIKKPSVKGQVDPRHKVFQKWWFKKFKYKFKREYQVTNWKQFGGQVKSLLKLPLSFEDLQYLAIEFFMDEDPFITGSDSRKGAGYNIGMFITRINQNTYQKYLDVEFRDKNKNHIVSESGEPM